ncbi:DUF7146 domain-containing protein [Paraburkholderia tuberum]|uniref:Toprim domain-containing protein n=1 Tax=Paraburkholderia tuberum TaxID=157910 RepID=A0A1H0ZP40_9BURK|nr:toprim domain-containing protein [Paraburkholderia tuberum]SDQ29117.1 Toprim domain-containing protein [Paraburkholderia tuberum]
MIAWSQYEPGQHRASCPECGRGERDKTLGITIEWDGKGVAHCFRCNHVETFRPEQGVHVTASDTPRIRATAPIAKHDTLSDYGRDLWAGSKPVAGVARGYLTERRCCIPPADGDLRWHPALKHPSGYVGPALIGLVTDAITCEPISLHRTWINADGTKADVDPPRMLLGGHRKQGGVIRLWPDEAVASGLGIAEGIETALSLAHGFEPVWSCIDAGNLAQFPVLPGIESLTIGVDNDPAGIDAANACAVRWVHADREVFVTRQAENDLNDTLAGAA